jgi:hypothetical protein
VIDKRQCFVETPFVFWLVLLLRNVALCNKEIVKTHFFRVFSLRTRLLSFDLLLAIPRLLLMNTGCYFAPSMVFGAVHDIGMIKSMQSSGPSVSPPCLKILVFTPTLSKIQRTRLAHNHQAHSPLVSTLMTSSIFSKTLPLKPSSVIFWPNGVRWIHGHCQVVPRHPFLLAHYLLVGCRSPQSIRFCI